MYSIYSYKDILRLKKFMQGKPISEQEIGNQLLMETVALPIQPMPARFCSTTLENYLKDSCGNCDNCLHPKKHFDGQEQMLTVIELILSLKEYFVEEHLANILAESPTQNQFINTTSMSWNR